MRGDDPRTASTSGSNRKAGAFRRFSPVLFLAAVEFAWCVFLAASRTIPRGHDGFQYFYLKYYFFNDFVRTGELAQWLPYLTHGSPSAWWYVVQSGIFDPAVLFLARVARLHDFLPIFYSLLFLEKLLLILGTWLFAAEHLKSRVASFAVTAAVTLTSIWYTQAWWNFHAIVALPMLLFLLHRTIRDFRWAWPVGLALLLYLQTFGHLSYYLPMTLLFLALYAGQMIAQPEARTALRERFRLSVTGLMVFAAVNAALLLEMVWLRRSSGEIVFPSSQRGANGAVSLGAFLNYGGYTDLRAWNQFFSGLTPHLDFTLFAGFLMAGLTVIALSSGPLNKVQRVFARLAAVTLLIATASPLATIVFYFWPLAQLFRHLALLLPVAKFFCVFLAGATLDRLVCESRDREWPFRTSVVLTVVFAAWLVLLMAFALDPSSLQSFLQALTTETLPALESYGTEMMPQRLFLSAAFLALTLIALLTLLRVKNLPEAKVTRLAWVAALLLFVDVSTYGILEMRTRTLKLSPREAAIFQFTPLPYVERRIETPESTENVRRRTFSKSIAKVVGSRYWAENLLWLVDSYRTSNRTVFWSTALDSLLQALRQRPGWGMTDTGEILALPTDDALLAAISGFREPKIRFFTRAIVCPDPESTAAFLSHSTYRGQAALLTGNLTLAGPSSHASPSKAPAMVTLIPCDASALTTDVDAPAAQPLARVAAFSSNRAEFDVENPTNESLVMTYSDSWSDHWRARVDEAEAPVFRSDLAYKAVVVPSGNHRVAFEYRDRVSQSVFVSQGLASLSFLVFLGALIRWRIVGQPGGPGERKPNAFWFSTT